jgi:small subunit ribosomal protein S18
VKRTKFNKPDRDRGRSKAMRERMECRFCRDKIDYIDYKDIDRLQKLLTQRGKIFSRKRSGNCAGCQRKAQKAIKRARYMALLPYAT